MPILAHPGDRSRSAPSSRPSSPRRRLRRPAASVAPSTPRPTPVVTPDPHLAIPATRRRRLPRPGPAGLRLTAINAEAGAAAGRWSSGSTRRTSAGPSTISQYRSAADLDDEAPWTSGERARSGRAAGGDRRLNILVQWGPTTGRRAPDAGRAPGRRAARPGRGTSTFSLAVARPRPSSP